MIVVRIKKGQINCPHMYTNSYKLISADGKEVNISQMIYDIDSDKLISNTKSNSNIKETLSKFNNIDNKYIWLITNSTQINKMKYPINIENLGYLLIDEQSTLHYDKVIDEFLTRTKNLTRYDDKNARLIWLDTLKYLKDKKLLFDHCQLAIMFKSGSVEYNGLPKIIGDNSTEPPKQGVRTVEEIIKLYDDGGYITKDYVRNLSLEDTVLLIKKCPRIFLAILRESTIPIGLKDKGNHYFNSKVKSHSVLKKRTTVKPFALFPSNDKNEEKCCVSCNVRMNKNFLSTIHIYGKPEDICDECERLHLNYFV